MPNRGIKTEENPKFKNLAKIIETICDDCDQMYIEFCLHRCIYQILFNGHRVRE